MIERGILVVAIGPLGVPLWVDKRALQRPLAARLATDLLLILSAQLQS